MEIPMIWQVRRRSTSRGAKCRAGGRRGDPAILKRGNRSGALQRIVDEPSELCRQLARPFMFVFDRELGRLKRMARQEEFTFKLRGPTRFDKFEIELLVRPGNLFADNPIPKRGESHPNLMCASR